jgi:hypothetical protein
LLPSIRILLAIAAAGFVAACADLLPKAKSEIDSPWRSFAQARAAIEAIEPGRAATEQLRAIGLDPVVGSNVQLLTYSDIALRFPVNVAPDRLDPGLRQCLEAGKGCTGYYINVHEVRRDRVGGFWSDTLGFNRILDVSGWSFNALILTVNDRVVYTLHGGQPNLHEQEITRHPLGPLQTFGESISFGRLVR